LRNLDGQESRSSGNVEDPETWTDLRPRNQERYDVMVDRGSVVSLSESIEVRFRGGDQAGLLGLLLHPGAHTSVAGCVVTSRCEARLIALYCKQV
jgi:hypothetical protein